MIAALITGWTWLTTRTGALIACITAGLGILWMLLENARRAGRDAERAKQEQRNREARDAADKAAAAYRADGAARRLREGKF